jgi:hypothetical protein
MQQPRFCKSYNIVWILSTRLHLQTVKTQFDGKMTNVLGMVSMSKSALSAPDKFKTKHGLMSCDVHTIQRVCVTMSEVQLKEHLVALVFSSRFLSHLNADCVSLNAIVVFIVV